ncbi:MAG TPA: MFS transporter [Methyloceanibacter sp.]|nr:MFS transporter [Methyloceanibacter sp.]
MAEKVEVRAASPPRAWRLGFLYAAVFLVGGCYLPYLPVWLHWRDLTADQIAVLLVTPPFARIVFTPAISFAADRAGGRRPILIGLAWGSLGSFLLLWAGPRVLADAARELAACRELDDDLAAGRDCRGKRHQARHPRLRQSAAVGLVEPHCGEPRLRPRHRQVSARRPSFRSSLAAPRSWWSAPISCRARWPERHTSLRPCAA